MIELILMQSKHFFFKLLTEKEFTKVVIFSTKADSSHSSGQPQARGGEGKQTQKERTHL